MPPEKKRSHEMPRRKNHTAGPAAARRAAHGAPSPDPVPGTGPAPDDPAAAVQAALAANPDGATAAAIADAAGISRTAAREALTGLETVGAAARTKGGRPGIADTWRPAVTVTASSPPEAAGATGPLDTAGADGDSAAAEPAGRDEATAEPAVGREPGQDLRRATGQPLDSPAGDAQDGPGDQDTAPGPGEDGTAGPAAPGDADNRQQADGGDGAEASPDPAVLAETNEHTAQIQHAAAGVATALSGGDLRAALAGIEEICERAGQARRALKAATSGRKAPAVKPGALRELVAAHLRDHPGKNFTPHQIGKVLSRSSGAVANALDRLVGLGEAELATEKPRSFRLAATASPPVGRQAGTTPATGGGADGDAAAEPMAGAA
jgi:hypothetical protein